MEVEHDDLLALLDLLDTCIFLEVLNFRLWKEKLLSLVPAPKKDLRIFFMILVLCKVLLQLGFGSQSPWHTHNVSCNLDDHL